MSAVSARSIRRGRRAGQGPSVCNGCFTAVPSQIQRVVFTPCMAMLARSDVLWRAWVDVRANQGAPGVDGVRIADVEASGGGREFLDELAAAVDRAGRIGPARLRRVIFPSLAAGAVPAARNPHRARTGW